MYRKIILIILIIGLPLGGLYVWANYQPEIARFQSGAAYQLSGVLIQEPVRRILAGGLDRLDLRLNNSENSLLASGYIEATTVSVKPEQAGRVVTILAKEGDLVKKGADLVYLDNSLLKAQLKKAQAELRIAETTLAKLEAGARPEEIRKAEALVKQAEAAENAAYVVWQDAILLRDNPQELEMQVNLARTQAEGAQYQLMKAGANKDAAQLSMDALGRLTGMLQDGVDYAKSLPTGQRISGHISFGSGEIEQASNQWNQATNAWWQTWINLEKSTLEKEKSEQYFSDIVAMRDEPQSLSAQADQAEWNYRVVQADTAAARAQLDWIISGATGEQVEAARSRVEQAGAKVQKVMTQLKKTIVTAPIDGRVTESTVNVGELGTPDVTMLNLTNLDRMTLTIYIPENQIGHAKLGQDVEVSIDSYPGQIFGGKVSYIAQEAEFTPKNVQTANERVNMVFAVKVDLPNPDHDLKAGMPADVVLLLGSSGGLVRSEDS